ncbi:MAG: hypothetical protein GX221_11085 [Candidatus Riflebacteria bacterium]|nr:hypothetical protein [Candidatus Riflebacteria bacterium]
MNDSVLKRVTTILLFCLTVTGLLAADSSKTQYVMAMFDADKLVMAIAEENSIAALLVNDYFQSYNLIEPPAPGEEEKLNEYLMQEADRSFHLTCLSMALTHSARMCLVL